MAFVDHVIVQASSGRGGNGVVRWLRTKMTARGGPCGGDGGRGGNILIRGVADLAALRHFRYEKKFNAENGGDGKGEMKNGANAADVLLQVPIGTVARILNTGKEYEITSEGEEMVIFHGGRGGFGNAHFKSSTHQNPFEQTNGKEGEGGDIEFSLKIIAAAGLVGLPNAGKSSLLNALTRAKSKVGDYPFTTLEPNLGEFYGHILADIPGLIEGASVGRGLGIKFLKHVERTGILLHLVSATQDDPVAAYGEVRREIESFGHGLDKKREIIILSKTDLVSIEEQQTKLKNLQKATSREVLAVSTKDPLVLKEFITHITKVLNQGA